MILSKLNWLNHFNKQARHANHFRHLSWLFALLMSSITYASVISISPMKLFLSDQQPITLLNLANPGNTAVVMQIDVVKAHQAKLTSDILVTPPIFSISPQGEQLVRLAIVSPNKLRVAQDYRVLIREIVPHAIPIQHGKRHNQLKMALNLSIPLISMPSVLPSQ